MHATTSTTITMITPRVMRHAVTTPTVAPMTTASLEGRGRGEGERLGKGDREGRGRGRLGEGNGEGEEEGEGLQLSEEILSSGSTG